MFNFKVINKALTDVNLTDKEFRMLYLIVNNMSLNNTNSLEMFNGFLMDKLNIGERQVQRLTKSLEEKGYVTRTVECNSKSRNGIVYTLCDNGDDKLCDTECDKNVTPYNIEKNNIYNNIIYNNINNKNNNILIDNNSNILEEKENIIINNNIKEKEIVIPMKKELNITEAHLESASAEEKAISDDKWYQHLVEPKDELDELFAEEAMFHVEHTIPVEETQNKALGDVFSVSVDNYQGNEEKSAQNALKVPQTKIIDTSKVWTYVGREHNGEQMTVQECLDRGLKYWCLQDSDTNEFCTSEYI